MNVRQIYAGVTDLRNAKTANIHAISRVILHPQYDADKTNNDIALIKLAEPISAFSNFLMPACLPAKPITGVTVQAGSKGRRICYVTGWGLKSEGQSEFASSATNKCLCFIVEQNSKLVCDLTANGRGQIGAGSDILLQAAIEMFSAADCSRGAGGFNDKTMVIQDI